MGGQLFFNTKSYLKNYVYTGILGAVVLTLVFTLPLSSKVYAISDYDSVWRQATDMTLESPSCGSIDETSAINAQLASNTGWPHGGYVWAPNDEVRDYYHAITAGSTPGFISVVKTHQVGTDWTWVGIYAQQGTSFYSIWGDDAGNGHYARIPGPSFGSTLTSSGQWFGFILDDSTCDMTFGSIGGTSVAYLSNAGDGSTFSMENIELRFYNGAILDPNFPSSYAGPDLGPSTDGDGDGLTAAQEYTQGTSDDKMDTDGDGLDDKKESVWNADRDAEFCKTSVTPHVCSYPQANKKDLYVQIDWLDDGTYEYQPTGTQLNLVAAKFSDLGINFHADAGAYGGGNAIPVVDATAVTTLPGVDMPGDFYHHKYGDSSASEPANFDVINRYKIWHYMMMGYNYDDGSTGATASSGVAEGGGDDTFISYGQLAHYYSGSALDDAIAGTMVHELGHNLCLTAPSAPYTGQDSACAFSGIDNASASPNYHSAMNYIYQKSNNYSYSDGTNATGDHNDLSGIAIGMDDFQNDDDYLLGGI